MKHLPLVLLLTLAGCASLEERCAEKYGDATDGYWQCMQTGIAKRQMLLQLYGATRQHNTQCYGVGPNLRCVSY